MADPNELPYKSPVVSADQYSVTYDNGYTLPRQGSAHEDALVFERAGGDPFAGIQRVPAPMGGYGHGPLLAWEPGDLSPTEDPYPQAEGEAATAAYERAQMPSPISDAGVPAAPSYQEGSGVPMVAPAPMTAPTAPPIESSMENYTAQAPVVPPMGAPAPANTLTPEQIEQRNRAQLAGLPDPFAPAPAAPSGGQGVSFAARPQFRVSAGVVSGGGGSPLVRTNQTVQEVPGVPIPQELMIQRGQEIQSQVAATQALAAQRAADAQARADMIAQQVADQNVRNAANRETEQARQAAMRQADTNYQSAIASFQKQAVDPAKWYHDRGTAGTILAAIAMGMGAFAKTLTGGENTALSVIQSAIQDDIESQRINIANAREGVVLKGNLLSEMRARFGDERSAELATEAALTRQAANQAAQLEAAAQAAGAPIEGDLASQALRQRGTEAEIELRNREADRRTIQTQTQSGGGGGMSAQSRAEARARGIEEGLYIPGAVVDNARALHISEAQRQKTADLVAGTQRMDDLFAEMERIYRAHGRAGSNIPFSEAASEIASLSNQIMMQYNSNMSLGALDNGTVGLLRTVVPTGTSFEGATLARIQNARRRGLDSANRGLRVNGYRFDSGEAPSQGTPEVGTQVGAQRGD